MSKENNDSGWRPSPHYWCERNFCAGTGRPRVTRLLRGMPRCNDLPDPLCSAYQGQSSAGRYLRGGAGWRAVLCPSAAPPCGGRSSWGDGLRLPAAPLLRSGTVRPKQSKPDVTASLLLFHQIPPSIKSSPSGSESSCVSPVSCFQPAWRQRESGRLSVRLLALLYWPPWETLPCCLWIRWISRLTRTASTSRGRIKSELGICSTSSLCTASCSCLVHRLSGHHPPQTPEEAPWSQWHLHGHNVLWQGVQPRGMDSHLLKASLPSASLALGIKAVHTQLQPTSSPTCLSPRHSSSRWRVLYQFPVSGYHKRQVANPDVFCLVTCWFADIS